MLHVFYQYITGPFIDYVINYVLWFHLNTYIRLDSLGVLQYWQ